MGLFLRLAGDDEGALGLELDFLGWTVGGNLGAKKSITRGTSRRCFRAGAGGVVHRCNNLVHLRFAFDGKETTTALKIFA